MISAKEPFFGGFTGGPDELVDSSFGPALSERCAEVFAEVVVAGLLPSFDGTGFEVEEAPFDGLCGALGRAWDEGGVSRLMTLSAPRRSSESALRFGGAVCGAATGAAGFGTSPVIWARRSPI